MKRLKRILRWVVGLLLGTYLGLILLLSLPFFQQWLGDRVSCALSDHLQTRVEVGHVQLGLNGRLIIDDIHLWDRQGQPMLTVARTGAKVSLLTLLRTGDIHINNALLFGAHARLYQAQPDSATNFQFVIDAFKSDEQEKKPMPHISVSSILVRHTSVIFDQLWKPETPGRFNPGHLNISELSLNAQLHSLTQDFMSLTLRRFSLQEQSGFKITSAQARVERDKDDIRITDFTCTTPQSTVSLPRFQYNLATRSLEGNVQASLVPADIKAFHAPLAGITIPISAQLSFALDSLHAEVHDMVLRTGDESLDADIPMLYAKNLKDSIPGIDVKVKHLSLAPHLADHVEALGPDIPDNLSRLIQTLGESHLEGDLSMQEGQGRAQLHLTTAQGEVEADGSLIDRRLQAQIKTDGIQLGHILTALRHEGTAQADTLSPVGRIALTADADLTLPASTTQGIKTLVQSIRDGQPNLPGGKIKASIHEAEVKNYTYHNINLNLTSRGHHYDIQASAADPALTFDFQGNALYSVTEKSLQGLLDLQHLRLKDMHLTSKGIEDMSTTMEIDLTGDQLDNLSGDISIPHLTITDNQGPFTLTNLHLESHPDGPARHVSIQSPYLSLKADGEFQWSDLASFGQQTVHQWIPGIVKAPAQSHAECQGRFDLQLTDPTPLERIAGIPLHLDDGPLKLQATVDSRQEILNLEAHAPNIGYGEESLQNFSFSTHSQGEAMDTRIQVRRIMKEIPVDINVSLAAAGQQLTTRIDWDNHYHPAYDGSIALRAELQRQGDRFSMDGEVLPTTIHINDTTWNIQPTRISFRDKVLSIQDFRMTMEDGNRWLAIHGKASANDEDTLQVNLRGIELGYVFQLAKVKPLSLAGQASGDIYGTRLFSRPEARGHVIVPHILFNNADMGTCDAHLAWGVNPGTLDIQAILDDPANNARINANGYLHLVKDPIQSLDLNFVCQRANAHFLQRYVGGIMDDIQGRVTGNVRVYGPFKEVELQGEADVEEGALTIPSLNVRYHVQNEHVVLHPGGLILKDITGYDPMGSPGNPDHKGIINGEITYEHFRNMRYNFHVTGQNVLAYNFPEYGDLPFCGVVYGTGEVELSGRPGVTRIDIKARPTQGTQLQYKVATPETLTQTKFITFVDHNTDDDDNDNDDKGTKEEEKPEGDMNINFDLDITPDAEMRLLMDPVAGDYISLYGNSRIRATYYNKGSFRMYGTYNVDHGLYRMSIQDVIRKDFQFRKGGTIVFGGSPFQADLGLQAIYTVPSVSLNDLSARGTFSNNNVRVNCIMNLGGKAGEPRVTFDFDIPNVNDDELRMVRSLISTEEERNLQVIYLLGIGRFYTYDYTGTQTQSSTAMNSLLSSTISGQLNQMFSSMMGGNQNWNIGANLSTGDTGWSDMDVEGMLSGRLLNNRLLINGNFGYRDNPVAASNFIGDFDLQWILNHQGNLILKAYSETNDRYFTKSALTTQGVGLLLKKDFIRWSDLFRIRKKNQRTTPDSEENHETPDEQQ